jgi:hypothetical protein
VSDPTGGRGPEDGSAEPGETTGSTVADGAPTHSALVGFMSVPVHRRFPIRRSTLLMAVAFVGLAVLLYFNPPQSDAQAAAGSGAVFKAPDGTPYYLPNAVKVTPSTTTTTTTAPPVTTTTRATPFTTTTPSTGAGSPTTTSTTTTTTLPPGRGTGTGSSTTTTTAGTGAFGATTTTASR